MLIYTFTKRFEDKTNQNNDRKVGKTTQLKRKDKKNYTPPPWPDLE